MKLGIRGCLLNFRGTVEGRRVAERGQVWVILGDYREYVDKRVPGITCERQMEHTMGCVLMSLEEDAKPPAGAWWALCPGPLVSLLLLPLSLPQLLYVMLVMVGTCPLFRRLSLSQWSHLEIPIGLCSHRDSLSQSMAGAEIWALPHLIRKTQSLVYMPEFSCGIKLKWPFLLCSKLSFAWLPLLSGLASPTSSPVSPWKHLSKSLALEFLS